MKILRWLHWRSDHDLAEEIQAHIEMEIQENMGRGLTPEKARYAAARAFGNRTLVRERARETDPLHWLDTPAQDIRFGLRQLRRNPLLFATIALTLILGIGLNAAVFTTINAILFRPLVTRSPGTFVQLFAGFSGRFSRNIHGSPTMFTLEEYEVIRASRHSLAQATASAGIRATLGGSSPQELRGLLVSCNYLSTHLDAPLLGRTFQLADCAPAEAQPLVILNEALWHSEFDADPTIIGRTILLNKLKFTVIGVARNQLVTEVPPPALYIPYTMQSRLIPGDDFFRHPAEHAWLDLSGRLNPGYTRRQAKAELSSIAAQLDRAYPGRATTILVTNGSRIEEPFFSERASVVAGLVMSGFMLILLIVCANVAILLLARAAGRQQEMAVRLSLGASRTRLLRQLLMECILVSAIAAGVSLWFAPHLPRLILTAIGPVPPEVSFPSDWKVLLYTLSIAILTVCIAGISPALESLRFDLSKSLKPLGRGGASRRTTRVRSLLVAAQLAIGLALLTAASLTFRAQGRLFHLDLGYDPKHIIRLFLPLKRFGYDTHSAHVFHEQLMERLEGTSGVRNVAVTEQMPFGGESTTMVDVSESRDARDRRPAFFRKVSPTYFTGLGVRLRRGRIFTTGEAARTLDITPVVISEVFANRFWPHVDPLGKRFSIEDKREMLVVGVAADAVSLRAGEKDGPMLYEPLDVVNTVDAAVLVTFVGDPETMIRTIRVQIRELDPQLLVMPETIAAALEEEAERYSILFKLAGILAGLSLVLCLLGLNGLAAFIAAQRTQEVGIRLAIGAQKKDIVRLFLLCLIRPFVAGMVLGLGLAAVLGTLLAKARFLVDIAPIDPLSYGMATIIIAVAAFSATLVPILRAAQRDPWLPLHDE